MLFNSAVSLLALLAVVAPTALAEPQRGGGSFLTTTPRPIQEPVTRSTRRPSSTKDEHDPYPTTTEKDEYDPKPTSTKKDDYDPKPTSTTKKDDGKPTTFSTSTRASPRPSSTSSRRATTTRKSDPTTTRKPAQPSCISEGGIEFCFSKPVVTFDSQPTGRPKGEYEEEEKKEEKVEEDCFEVNGVQLCFPKSPAPPTITWS